MAQPTNLAQLLLERFRWFDESLRARLAADGWPAVSYAQSLVFAHLDGDGTSQSELARRVGVTRQAIHQTVGELVELGLVVLVQDPDNRRAKLVMLTPKGQGNVAAAIGVFGDLESELACRLGGAAVTSLRDALEAPWGEPEAR